MEEYIARRILPTLGEEASDGLFFLWQVRPSVIIGRNQVEANEVSIRYCREHGIEVFRRKSGGGCVYADEQNLMLSFVTRSEQVGLTYNRFMGMLLLVLRKMGIEATGTSHNDVMIGDRKVSGTAFYHIPNPTSQKDGGAVSIVHATLLYDTNMEHMLNAITPPQEKLQRKGVESVRQRITLLKDHTTMSLEQVKVLIRQTLCHGELMLTADDVRNIDVLSTTNCSTMN
jgi:lipoic acid synthetase/lipoate-protein ligase A